MKSEKQHKNTELGYANLYILLELPKYSSNYFLKFIYILKPYIPYKTHFGSILKENLTYMSM